MKAPVKDTKKAMYDREYHKKQTVALKERPHLLEELEHAHQQSEYNVRKCSTYFEEGLALRRRIDFLESVLISVGVFAAIEAIFVICSLL